MVDITTDIKTINKDSFSIFWWSIVGVKDP